MEVEVPNPPQDFLSDLMMRSFEGNPYKTIDEFLSALWKILGDGHLLAIHYALCKKHGMPLLGTSRVSYLSKSAVIKVPVSPEGFYNNDAEGSLISTEFVPEENLARTKLVYILDIPIVLMELVQPAAYKSIQDARGKTPDWVSCIDTCQVGFTKSGKLKAYDYADLL